MTGAGEERGDTFDVPFERASPVVVHAPADPDGSAVVLLHGQGMSPRSFAREALAAVPARTTAVLPQAPLPFEIRKTADDGAVRFRQGNAWYVYTGDTPEFLVELARSAAWVAAVADAAVARCGLDPARVDLLGFSQGGYLAGWAGLSDPGRWRRLVVAGARIKDEVLLDAARRAAASHPRLRVLDVHGADDEGVRPDPCRASAERIAGCGVPVEFRLFPGGHHVLREPACAAAVRDFLSAG